jgi:hypothetical protein
MYVFQKSLSVWKVHIRILSNKKGDVLTKILEQVAEVNMTLTPGSEGGRNRKGWGKHVHHTEQEPVISLQAPNFRQIMKRRCCATQCAETSYCCHF